MEDYVVGVLMEFWQVSCFLSEEPEAFASLLIVTRQEGKV
jgi:hypothetical protein